jgi:hypothetical protein
MAGTKKRKVQCSTQAPRELTEYELQRLRRIEENDRIMESLGLRDAGARLKAECGRKPARRAQTQGQPRGTNVSLPQRRSLRVQGVKAEPHEYALPVFITSNLLGVCEGLTASLCVQVPKSAGEATMSVIKIHNLCIRQAISKTA